MARPHIEPFVDRDVPFKKMTLPGFPKGMHFKMLSLDTATGACTRKIANADNAILISAAGINHFQPISINWS